MTNYKNLLMGLAVLGSLLIFSLPAQAQDETTNSMTTTAEMSSEAVGALTESANLADEPEVLEGVSVAEPTSVPSGFGLWWRNVREKVALGLTINPVKKAEKQLQFAEERIKLAEYMMQNSADAKVQEKAQQMLERANEYQQRVEEKKDNLINSSDKRARVLLSNLVKHQMNTERVFEKIEDKLPPEKLEQFQQFRQQAEERMQNFLADIKNNPSAPQAVKEKAVEVKVRIEAKVQERTELRAEQKEILDEVKAGVQEAKVELENLRQERAQKTEQARQEFKNQAVEVINKIKAGETEAVQELKALNQERRTEVKEIHQETKANVQEVKQKIKAIKKDGQQELKQNRVENRIENNVKNSVPKKAVSPLPAATSK